jgi:thiopeptide-type bacteriocin biosynthesis protein
MESPACLYALIHAPHERLESLLLDELAPIAHDLRGCPELDSLFFVRFSEPRWQLRFRILGKREWIEGPVRARVADRLDALARAGTIDSHSFTTYDREIERYGGPEGMALAEQLFTYDSFAALELCEADRRDLLRKSRREVAMVLTDQLIDLAQLTNDERLAFYRHGYSWALENGDWGESDLAALEARYQRLRPGLERLFASDPPIADEARWGGETAARIVSRFLEDSRPIVARILDGLDAGRITQSRAYLFWSYAHMFTNRMGIESGAEAVLRFFMHRFVQEHRPVAS